MLGDGNCLARSIMMALGMLIDDNAVKAFLKSLAEFIRQRPEVFASEALEKTFDPNSNEDATRFKLFLRWRGEMGHFLRRSRNTSSCNASKCRHHRGRPHHPGKANT